MLSQRVAVFTHGFESFSGDWLTSVWVFQIKKRSFLNN